MEKNSYIQTEHEELVIHNYHRTGKRSKNIAEDIRMKKKNRGKKQVNSIGQMYKREIVEMVENWIDDSDTKFLQQTYTIIKCHIERNG